MFVHFLKSISLFQYEQEILALRTAMEEMHHKLVVADDHIHARPEASAPDVVPSGLPHDPVPHHHSNSHLNSSPQSQSSAHHQHGRHNHQNPLFSHSQQRADPEIESGHMRDLLQK